MDKSNTKCERKEVTGGNDGGGRFIRENQSRSEEDAGLTARFLEQEMDNKPEKHLVHTPGSVIDSGYSAGFMGKSILTHPKTCVTTPRPTARRLFGLKGE